MKALFFGAITGITSPGIWAGFALISFARTSQNHTSSMPLPAFIYTFSEIDYCNL